jgi:hypothetical protein
VTVLVVFAYGFAVVFTVLAWRARLRRVRIAARPVLSIAEIADTEPGTAVVVAGRAASGPLLRAPWSGVPCVWWEDEVISVPRTRSMSKTEESGAADLHDDAGSRVEIAPALGRSWLLGDRERMMRKTFYRNYDYPDVSRTEHVVDAGTEVVVAGVVGIAIFTPGGRRLNYVNWVDGTARAPLDELPDELIRTERLYLASAVLLILIAVGLSLTRT